MKITLPYTGAFHDFPMFLDRVMIREDLTPIGCPLFAFIRTGLFDPAYAAEDGDEGDYDSRAELQREHQASCAFALLHSE